MPWDDVTGTIATIRLPAASQDHDITDVARRPTTLDE